MSKRKDPEKDKAEALFRKELKKAQADYIVEQNKHGRIDFEWLYSTANRLNKLLRCDDPIFTLSTTIHDEDGSHYFIKYSHYFIFGSEIKQADGNVDDKRCLVVFAEHLHPLVFACGDLAGWELQKMYAKPVIP